MITPKLLSPTDHPFGTTFPTQIHKSNFCEELSFKSESTTITTTLNVVNGVITTAFSKKLNMLLNEGWLIYDIEVKHVKNNKDVDDIESIIKLSREL